MPRSHKEYQDQKKLLDIVLTSLELKLNDLNLSNDPLGINEEALLTSGLEEYSMVSSNREKKGASGKVEKQLR